MYAAENHPIIWGNIQAEQVDSQHSSIFCLLHADFLFGLLFNSEDGADMSSETSDDFQNAIIMMA
jgi:hypothetical protein